VGQVDALHTSPNKDPLLFFAGEFGALHGQSRPRRRPKTGPDRGAAALSRSYG
jgi:hypothetical protein